MRSGIFDSSEKPTAAHTPESGTGTMTSAGTPCSRARIRPRLVRTSLTLLPNTTLSGREKYTCSNTHCERCAVADRILDGGFLRPRVEVQHDLRIGARLENRALPDEHLLQLLQLAGVHQVAVVADGELAVRAVDDERLRVRDPAFARRRIPVV